MAKLDLGRVGFKAGGAGQKARMRSRSLATAVALALTVSLAACTGETDDAPDDGPSSSTAAPVEAPPALEATWTSTADDVQVFGQQPTIAGDVLLQPTDRSVEGVDLTTGDVVWQAEMPQGLRVCSIAPQASEDGAVGLLLEGRGKPCSVVAALDTADGTLAWTREVTGERPYFEGRGVATGATTVAATFNCDELRRFRVSDGKPLGIIGRKDRKCAMETATDGRVVLALNDPETSDTPDDRGTGWIPPHDAAGAFELYDLDSGRLRWRRPIGTTRGASVGAVISSTGPTTVLAYGEGSTSAMRLVGPDGRPGAYLGRRLGSDDLPTVVGEADGVAVLRYGSSLLFAYDTATGEELWHLDHPGGAEVSDDGVVLATDAYVPSDDPTASGWQVWLTRVDLRDPERIVTLGSVPGETAQFLGPDRVLVGDALYDVPAEGEDRAYDVPPSPRATEWGDDDLTDVDVQLACDAVTSETLQVLGLDHPELPRPADCTWRDSSDPTYLQQMLRVSVEAFAPGRGMSTSARSSDPDDELTGPEVAADQVAWRIENDDSSYLRPLAPIDLPGLGDEAWAAPSYDSSTSGPSTHVVVRWRNVLVDVTASQDVQIEDRRHGAVPDDQVHPGVLAAVADVLEGLGAPAEERVAPATPTTEAVVPSVCRTLRTEAATLAPGVRASDQTPRGDGSDGATRQSACVWWGPDDDGVPDLDAMVHVVPASPFGTTGEQEARELLPGGFARTKPVKGLPGVRARFFRFTGDDSDYRSVGIDAIRGDTIVSVDYTDPDGGLDRAEGDRIVVRLVKQLLASVQR